MLEIGILGNSFQEILDVLQGCFWVFGCPNEAQMPGWLRLWWKQNWTGKTKIAGNPHDNQVKPTTDDAIFLVNVQVLVGQAAVPCMLSRKE